MRSLIPFFIVLFQVCMGNAQPNKLVNAQNYLQTGDLDEAKINIDLAAEHERTKTKEKTWRYRGDIYYAIYTSQNESYKNLVKDPLNVALDSYKKAIEIGGEGFYQDEIYGKLMIIGNYCLNDGVAYYNERRYKDAFVKFVHSVEAAKAMNKVDTLAIYNAGLSAEQSGDHVNAIYYYKQCVELGYRGASCCLFIVDQYRKQGNEESALNQINDCQNRFPNDPQIKISKINFYLRTGNNDKAKPLIIESIQNDPNNAVMHFVLGSILQNEGDLEGAKASYEKSIEINPDYFDPTYNLGALYYNLGVDVNNAASDLVNAIKIEEEEKKAVAYFSKAITYLERARELNPNNRTVLNSLKELYARTGDAESYNEVKKALDQ